MFTPQDVATTLEQIRHQIPLIHNITNLVVTQLTANVLLALGASPAMVNAKEEVEEFVEKSNALLINLGTINHIQAESMLLAAQTANKTKTPWVLDPVGVGALQFRSQIALQLLSYHPKIIRGNPSEIISLNAMIRNQHVSGGRGADSLAQSDEALSAAQSLSRFSQSIVSISGKTDYITDGIHVIAVYNGDSMMPRITGSGCSASAITAACLAVQPNALAAGSHAMTLLGVAGQRASKLAKGPASLQTGIIDELYRFNTDILLQTAEIKQIQ